MKPGFPRIDVARIGDTIASLKDGLVQPVSRMIVELQTMLGGGLTFTDNFNAAIVKMNLTHGVEAPLTSPLRNKAPPIGIYALRSEPYLDTARYAIDSLDWRIDADSAGNLGITAKFDLSHTAPFLFASKSANQSFGTSGASAAITWDTLDDGSSTTLTNGIIRVSGSSITVTESGLYGIEVQTMWASNITGNRYAYLQKNALTYSPGVRSQVATNGDVTYLATYSTVRMTTADTVVAFGNQTSGGALNLNGNAFDANASTKLHVTRLSSQVVPQNTVTLLVVGA